MLIEVRICISVYLVNFIIEVTELRVAEFNACEREGEVDHRMTSTHIDRLNPLDS